MTGAMNRRLNLIALKLCALAFGLLLGLILVEAGLRATGMGFGNSPMEPDPYLHHVHPRNYRFIQQHPSGELGGFEIRYNAEGRVDSGEPVMPRASAAACRVAFMGDSFTEAGQVPYRVSFAGVLEKAAAVQCDVRNYGVRSYSPAIYLVQWTRELRPWKPTHVFLLLFGNDVREDVTYMRSAVVDAQGWPTAIEGPSDGWLVSQLRTSYTARFARMLFMRAQWAWQFRGQEHTIVGGVVEENPDLPRLSTELILEMNRRVRADGAKLIVMVVPSRYRLMGDGSVDVKEDFHQKVKIWARANDVEFLDLYDPFARGSRSDVQLFFKQDIHFTEEGHALAAAAIGRGFPELFPGWKDIDSRSVQLAYEHSPAR
jgi:hypothetical protein